MISMLAGRVFERDEESLHIEVHGVGYKAHVPQRTLADYVVGSQVRLRIYTHVREDQITLFGFETQSQIQLFNSLIKVNGVGPKVALGILSASGSEEFKGMVASKDIKALSRLPKVGKRTAEQILLKLGGLDWSQREPSGPLEFSNPEAQKLRVALVNLGFSVGDVQEILSETDFTQSFENNFKNSLNKLSQI